MKKLHADGLLESLDYESFDSCEPCLMGKMTKTPFFGTMERATDLLEIIPTDVCDPMIVKKARHFSVCTLVIRVHVKQISFRGV